MSAPELNDQGRGPVLEVTHVECANCEEPLHLADSGWWVGANGRLQCDRPWQPIHKPVRVAVTEPESGTPDDG